MHRISAVALALALAPPVSAADQFDADARARAVAPFVDEQTVGVAHVDLTRIDAGALLARVAEVAKLGAEEIEGPKRELGVWLAALARAGGKEMYVVLSLADLPAQPPLVVVPLGAGADADAIRRELSRVKPFEHLRFETRGRAVVGGTEDTLRRLRALKPSA